MVLYTVPREKPLLFRFECEYDLAERSTREEGGRAGHFSAMRSDNHEGLNSVSRYRLREQLIARSFFLPETAKKIEKMNWSDCKVVHEGLKCFVKVHWPKRFADCVLALLYPRL